MAHFRYCAIDATGRRLRGRLQAANLRDLELRLARMDLDLIDFRIQGDGAFGRGGKSMSRRDLIHFCFQLQQLSAAGVPLLEGLADIRDTSDQPRLRTVVADLIESIESGKVLSEAMGRHPALFDEVFVNLVRAGECSGQLPTVFAHLTQALKSQDELIAQSRRILTYPGLVALVVTSVTYFLATWLVPQLIPFIHEMGGVVPWYTRALIAGSRIILDYSLPIAGVPVVAVAGVLALARSSRSVRRALDRAKLSAWLVGPILRNLLLSRFASAFALMYASGITVLDGLRLIEKAMGNLVMEEGIERAWRRISNGERISDAFASEDLFPPLVLRMIRVGEATGQLDVALGNVSDFYTREVHEAIDRIQAVLPVIMTIVLGAMIGMVMLAVLGPLYDTIGGLQP